MAINKPTEGPKAKLMKLSVTTLRSKAKALNISDYTKRTKENLVQSIMISEARKKGAAKQRTATKQGSLFKPARATRSGEQTGRSDTARDSVLRALAPGKRLSRTGKVYYERRRNRSDVPPTMLGKDRMYSQNASDFEYAAQIPFNRFYESLIEWYKITDRDITRKLVDIPELIREVKQLEETMRIVNRVLFRYDIGKYDDDYDPFDDEDGPNVFY